MAFLIFMFISPILIRIQNGQDSMTYFKEGTFGINLKKQPIHKIHPLEYLYFLYGLEI